MPPMTTVANCRCTSAPVPTLNAIIGTGQGNRQIVQRGQVHPQVLRQADHDIESPVTLVQLAGSN